jgi:hypothetical protein
LYLSCFLQHIMNGRPRCIQFYTCTCTRHLRTAWQHLAIT